MPDEISKEWQELLDFMALPVDEQLRIGRAARQQATKGVVADVPRCSRCKRISVLNPCRECASPKQLAEWPSDPRDLR